MKKYKKKVVILNPSFVTLSVAKGLRVNFVKDLKQDSSATPQNDML